MNKFQDTIKASLMALVMAGVIAGCGGGGSGGGSGSGAVDDPNWTVAVGAGTGVGGAGRGPAPLDLGVAGNYAVLAQSLISTTATAGTAITGDIGISPAAASFIQGFSLTLDGTGCFSTTTPATLVTGQVFAADYNTGTCTTPTVLGTAIADKDLAFTDANGRAADHVDLGTGTIGGMTLPPAVYKWATGVLIPTDLVLSGGPDDVWIFQVAQDITVANAVRVTLTGGALAKNIFWASGGVVSFGTTAHFEGIVLSASSITLNTGASANGRMLAKTDVTLDSNAVTQPAP